MTHTYAEQYMREVSKIALALADDVERMAEELVALRARNGRLFLLGLGGSAANCSHAASDFRTLCEIDAHSLTESMAEFSARANDFGLHNTFRAMLVARRVTHDDALLVMSVGGGTDLVSTAITGALQTAPVLGIVGPNGGATAEKAVVCIRIPAPADRVTPHTEAFQAVIWHCLVSHPLLQRHPCKW